MTREEELERMVSALMRGTKNPYTSPQITMESQVDAQLQHLDPANMPGMPSYRQDLARQSTQSTAGREARLGHQQRMANALMATKMPQGKTVGPSNIYVNNPWDSAGAAFDRAAGGYLSGKLKSEYDDIDTAKSNAAMAGIEREDMLIDDANRFDSGQTGLKLASAQAIADTRNATDIRGQDMTNAASIRSQDMTAANAAGVQAGANARDVVPVSYFNPNADAPGQPPVLTYRQVGKDVVDHNDDVVDITGLTPYKAVSPQSLTHGKPTAAQLEDTSDAAAGMRTIKSRFPNMARLAQYTPEQVEKYTGWNATAFSGRTVGWGKEGEEAQQFSSMMSADEIGGLLPAITEAKLTPTSDKDVNMVREKYVNSSKQPGTIAQFYAYEGRQFVARTIQHNVANGNTSAEEGAAVQQDYDKMAATMALAWGYEPENLITAGMDPELVAYLVEAKRRGGAQQ